MDIPSFFSDKQYIMNFDYDSITEFIDSEIDESFYIENLSIPLDKKIICKDYFKSILLGYNHIYIDKLLETYQTHTNICLPLLHRWEGETKINNMVIISDPEDGERICKTHIKKAPIFTSFLYDSLISTTDNNDWKQQRDTMNIAFVPSLSLKKVFSKSNERAELCSNLLKDMSHNFTRSVNMSEFFLNETQAQLQLSMFGFSNEFQDKTNKKIRNAFAGIDVTYTEQFTDEALEEVKVSHGPLSKIIDIDHNDVRKNKSNLLIFAFAGHDTTGHTLSWLLYELCNHPKYKQELKEEVDKYWLHHNEPTYNTLNELPFMTKCITETLRLWPALANGTYRELEHDELIKGIDGNPVSVPKGTYCQIINWTRHRSSELWGDDVTDFNPYREFKDSEIWNYEGFGTTNLQSERFSPFTYGPRNCIGKNFSHMEMRLILLYLFKNYDFELSKDQLQMKEKYTYEGVNLFTLGPGSIKNDELLGMYINIIPRFPRL